MGIIAAWLIGCEGHRDGLSCTRGQSGPTLAPVGGDFGHTKGDVNGGAIFVGRSRLCPFVQRIGARSEFRPIVLRQYHALGPDLLLRKRTERLRNTVSVN
jgi:hypothetical protein